MKLTSSVLETAADVIAEIKMRTERDEPYAVHSIAALEETEYTVRSQEED